MGAHKCFDILHKSLLKCGHLPRGDGAGQGHLPTATNAHKQGLPTKKVCTARQESIQKIKKYGPKIEHMCNSFRWASMHAEPFTLCTIALQQGRRTAAGSRHRSGST
jgi:hypothetical protein